MRTKQMLALLLAFVIVAAACGSDSSSDSGGDATSNDDAASAEATTGAGSASSDESGAEDAEVVEPAGRASILTFDGEEIALNALGCFAEEQEVAGSIITLSAQASGTNAAGENVLVDFTRFAPDGVVGEADDILIDIGPLGAGRTYQANLPFESVPVEDGVLTLTATTFSSFDDGSEVMASVAIVC